MGKQRNEGAVRIASTKVRVLGTEIIYKDTNETAVKAGTDNPCVTAQNMPQGSIYWDVTNKRAFQKMDSGNTTNFRLLNDTEFTKDPTGFIDNSNIKVTYDSSARTITLDRLDTPGVGNVEFLLKGRYFAYGVPWTVPSVLGGMVAKTHAATPAATIAKYYLWIDPDTYDVKYDTDVWTFDKLMIAFTYVDTNQSDAVKAFSLREVHGLQPQTTHKGDHERSGTYITSATVPTALTYAVGGAAPTDADNTPGLDSQTVNDEDIATTIDPWIQGTYTTFYRSGSTSWVWSTVDTFPFKVATNSIQYNPATAGSYALATPTEDNFVNILVLHLPVTADTDSQKFRTIWITGQREHATLTAAQQALPSQFDLTNFVSIVPELVASLLWTYRYNAAPPAAFTSTGRCGIAAEPVRFVGSSRNNIGISGVTPTDHTALSNRDAVTSHPIGAIGSDAALAARIPYVDTTGYLTTDSALKVDPTNKYLLANGLDITSAGTLYIGKTTATGIDLLNGKATLSSAGAFAAGTTSADVSHTLSAARASGAGNAILNLIGNGTAGTYLGLSELAVQSFFLGMDDGSTTLKLRPTALSTAEILSITAAGALTVQASGATHYAKASGTSAQLGFGRVTASQGFGVIGADSSYALRLYSGGTGSDTPSVGSEIFNVSHTGQTTIGNTSTDDHPLILNVATNKASSMIFKQNSASKAYVGVNGSGVNAFLSAASSGDYVIRSEVNNIWFAGGNNDYGHCLSGAWTFPINTTHSMAGNLNLSTVGTSFSPSASFPFVGSKNSGIQYGTSSTTGILINSGVYYDSTPAWKHSGANTAGGTLIINGATSLSADLLGLYTTNSISHSADSTASVIKLFSVTHAGLITGGAGSGTYALDHVLRASSGSGNTGSLNLDAAAAMSSGYSIQYACRDNSASRAAIGFIGTASNPSGFIMMHDTSSNSKEYLWIYAGTLRHSTTASNIGTSGGTAV